MTANTSFIYAHIAEVESNNDNGLHKVAFRSETSTINVSR